ncbi:site-specific integrase [Bifidobacterium callitrichos]|nr:site-specific integrase [Bifidobacterium callitrichos]
MGVSRRKFGSLVPRLGADGLVRSYLAEYTYHGRTVRRTFRDEADASSWLSGERRAVDLDRAGVEPWAPPDARNAMGPDGNGSASGGDVLFVDYADAWAANLRSRNGGELRGSSRRRVLYIVSLLKEGFPAPLRLADLDPGVIRDWYEHRRPESDWSFRECCVRLNAMLRDASDPDRDGGPLIDRNPYRMPVPPKPDVDSHDAPPVTPQQLKGLYEAFPDYTRLSVLLVCLAGGMRTGEVCALRVGDIDLDGGTLRVSHSVSRGADDRGELRLGPTKTPGSHRTVPIPSSLIPLIRAHIDAHCGNDPDSPLFVAKRGKRISQRTLDHQMDVARKQAGRPDLTFRMLRASHATMYMVEGGTLREAMAQLGHRSDKVAVESYQRIVPEHRRSIADRVADRMLEPDAGQDDVVPSDGSESCRMFDSAQMGRLLALLVDVAGRVARVEALASSRLPALLDTTGMDRR